VGFSASADRYGGPAGAAAQVAGQGVGVYFLKFSREYEMKPIFWARGSWRCRSMTHTISQTCSKTIDSKRRRWRRIFERPPALPIRYARINQEAQYLRVNNPIRDTRDFDRIQARLRGWAREFQWKRFARSGQRYFDR